MSLYFAYEQKMVFEKLIPLVFPLFIF